MNQIHKRNTSENLKKDDDESIYYDAEHGVQENNVKRVNDFDKKIGNLYFNLLVGLVVLTLCIGTYMEVFNKSIKTEQTLNHHRKLNSNRNIKNDHCKRSDYTNVLDYVRCYADSSHVLVISDTDSHKMILEKQQLLEYQIDFQHVNDIFNASTDVIDFLNMFENKTPWIFVEGSFIGSFKELVTYYDYGILNDGLERSKIKPTLNKEEENIVSSNDIKNVNYLKIRRNLRQLYLNNHTLSNNHHKPVLKENEVQFENSGIPEDSGPQCLDNCN